MNEPSWDQIEQTVSPVIGKWMDTGGPLRTMIADAVHGLISGDDT